MAENHFTATGIVFNKNNEILMIKHKKLHVWLPPGGHVEENELPDGAVLREIFEETGINAAIMPRMKRLNLTGDGCRELETPFAVLLEDINSDGTHNHIDLIYLCSAQTEALAPDANEIDDIGWFSHEQIKQMETYDNVRKTIDGAIQELSLAYINSRAVNGKQRKKQTNQ